MDKLTWYDEDGRLYCRRGYEVALARLASYEATELMPDEIVKMGMMFEDSKRYSGRLELKLVAAAEKLPQWVSVTERMPELEVPVLVLDRRGNMIVRTLRRLVSDKEAVFRPDGLAPRKNITHWMPLPDAPEVQQQDHEPQRRAQRRRIPHRRQRQVVQPERDQKQKGEQQKRPDLQRLGAQIMQKQLHIILPDSPHRFLS